MKMNLLERLNLGLQIKLMSHVVCRNGFGPNVSHGLFSMEQTLNSGWLADLLQNGFLAKWKN
jgi:hypothetical protein